MAGQKLTEKQLASLVKQDASFVLSQKETVNGTEIEAIRRAQISVVIAALRSYGVNRDYITESKVNDLLGGYVNNIAESDTGISVTYGDGSVVEIPIESGGLAFDEIFYDKDTGYFHIRMNGVDVVDPTYVGGGGSGSGGGSKLTFSCYTSPSFSVIDSTQEAIIQYKFTSLDADTEVPTGSGNLAITVGGIVRANMVIEQGDNLTVDVYKYLSKGSNTVRLTITDSYGATATRTFTIALETFDVSWSLDSTVINTEQTLSFYITPTGNGSKNIYTYVDGTLHSTDTVTTSGRRLTKTISDLAHGAHMIEVYGTMDVSGTELESNHLTAAVAQVLPGYADAVVAVNWPSGPLTQYTSVNIPYVVVDPTSNPATVTFKEDQTVLMEVETDQTSHVWAYRPLKAGYPQLSICCGDTVSSKTYAVGGLELNVEEIVDGLEIKVDPSTISDLRTWSQNGYSFTLSDHFDLVNGGLMVDENGVHCIRVTAGDRLTLNYDPFATDTIATGKELKIIYRIADCSDKETVAINATSDGKGLEVQANNVYLRGDQNFIVLSTCEDEKTELDMNIQKYGTNSDRLMMMWERCSTFSYKQYAQQEDFRHNPSTGITFGSDDADVYLYLLRGYNRDLTNAEIRANYIVDGSDGADIYQRSTRNDIYDGTGAVNIDMAAAKNPDCHFLLINAERMTLGKKDAVEGTLRHTYISGGAEHQFTADVIMKVQGTSSVEHAATAGPNINFEFVGGIKLDDGTVKPNGYAMNGEANSIPTNLITYKKNVASQDHIVNRATAHWYNTFQPSVREARKNDHRIRDCLESTMCAVFFHNTADAAVLVGPDTVQPGETIFFGLGNICSNKDAAEVFDYDDIVIEVKNNTEPQVRFKSNDLTGDKFDTNYEFRYLNEDSYTEDEAKAEWQAVQDFVFATDYTAATGDELAQSEIISGVTYTHDTADYRKARWTAEAPDIFDMDTLLWHHNITLFLLLRDNRAKNMFWSKSKTTGKWGLWFNWDNDTGLCRNNEGYVDMEPGYMDFDTIGTKDVFNAADNAIFTNLRACNFEQLRASYLDRENAGAWDIDAFYKYVQDSQDQICESLWLEDAEHNAIRTLENLGTAAYLERATGRLSLHIKKALTFQKALVDSYYNATASTADSASFRGYTPQTWAGVEPNGKFTIAPYTNLYINVLAGSTSYQVRANAGEAVELDITAALNDTEIYIRNAGWIQEMGDLSALYLGQFEAARLKRVRKLLIGSSVDGYFNTAFTTATFDNCVKLEELNLGGLKNAAQTFDLSNNLYLRTIYTKGSGVSGLRFARNGRLRKAELNAITSLYMNGLWMLEDFSIESYDNLGTLTIEDCEQIDSLAIVQEAAYKKLSRLRLTDIDWTLDGTDLTDKLLTIGGLNDNGFGQDISFLTGRIYVPIMRQSLYDAYTAAWPELTLEYGRFVAQHTVTFMNWDDEVLYIESVDQGSDAFDPILSGDIPTPTRPSTDEYSYTYKAWDTSLATISGPRTIRATYTATKRTYTVRWMNNGVEEQRKTISYGDEAVYDGEKPTYTLEEAMLAYNLFKGWDQSTGRVTGDMTVNALFERADMSQGISSTEDLTATQAYGLKRTGSAALQSALQTKDRVNITLGYQPEFTNVEYWEAEPEQAFDGTRYVDTGLQLLKNGIADPWTLVVDFEFTDTTANTVLMSLWQDDGYMGFKLRYSNNGPTMVWGTNSYASQQGAYREIMVLRHQPGSQMVYVYSSNTGNNVIALTPLLKTIDTITDHTLIFGCDQNDAGEMHSHAKGIVHSCRVWYDDLGNTECQRIVSWPREKLTFEVDSYGGFQISEDTSQYTSVDFISAGIMKRMHRMNATNTNEGGYAETEMYSWMEARVYNAFPEPWKSLIQNVNIPYVIRVVPEDESAAAYGEIKTVAGHVFLPAYAEVYHTDQEPWVYEGDWITFFTSNADRLKFRGYVRPENQQVFSQNTDPCLIEQNNVQDGDVWCNTADSGRGYLRVNGEWLSATSWWLRGASILNSTSFCYVYWNGYADTNGNNATSASGVVPRFSI